MTAADRPTTRAELQRVILGQETGLTSDEVARRSGMTVADARRLWRALGFPDPGEEAAFGDADADALAAIGAAVGGGLDLDTIVRMTRAVGQTVARLAAWEIAILRGEIEQLASDRRLAEARTMVETIGPEFEALLVYAWRRHLAAAVSRLELLGDHDEDQQVAEATVGFADLVSFTALTNQLDEDEIGDLVEIFESRCHDVVADRHGRVVKTLGDSVLFLADSPEEGIDIALDIIGVIGRDERLPDVRLGLATGPVVLRMGDVYGPSVNLAARLTTVARRNRVIIDEHTAELLSDLEFETRRLPARPVRGFGDIEPITVRRTRPRH
ncbi:MAG TPA: adenylate/guanylate cyclase domain-containing protein [Marmoricola sp.]|nr:adenylate/guanylate cyclase domain-containing protein [Marmoricola sp.]